MATQTTAITEKWAELSHGKTRYFEAGTGYPTILIHGAGFTNAADSWLPLMEPLAAHGLRVLAIDCVNWGPGDVLNAEFSFAYLVDQLREFMDALGIEKANIVGHSMGGWIATLLGYESPDRINRLVLSSPGGARTRPLQSMVEFKVPSDEQLETAIKARLESLPAGIDPAYVLGQYKEKARKPEHGAAFGKVMAHMSDPVTRARYQTLRRLPYIKVPTLVLWGTADQVNDISMAQDVHGGIKGSKLVTFEGKGHGLPMEVTDEYVKEIGSFLAG